MSFEFKKCFADGIEISGLYEIFPKVFGDARGHFFEVYSEKDFFANGLTMKFVQDNQSSSSKGVLRGLHYQKQHPQAKLVRVIKGEVFDVAVDLRKDSATYGKWYGVLLSEENKKQFLISEGFAHGFLVLSETAEFCYKVTDFWHQGDEGGLRWNDPDIGIEWPDVVGDKFSDGTPLNINDRDRNYPGIKDAFKF